MTCPWRGDTCNTPEGVCTARWAAGRAAGDICGATATGWIGDSPVCHHHYERAMDWYHKYRAELPEQNRLMIEEANRVAAEKARLAAEARSVIYYLRRGDGLIKIGVTGSYRNRLSSLRREHGSLRLLLAHAGTRREELQAHRRFYRYRVGQTEWFRPELKLLLEIQRLRNAWNGQPSKLPEQVPIEEIKAIIKAVRYPEAEAV